MKQATDDSGSDVEMEPEDGEAAMAAAMGFSGFGKAPATKKRKYNSKTDAFIDGQELQNIDKGGKKGQGSGGNEVPLGRMRVLGASSAGDNQNGQQGPLDTKKGDEDQDRPMEERCLDTSRPAPADEKIRNDAMRAERRGKPMINEDEIMLDDDEEGDNIAPSQSSSKNTAAQEAQSKIDAIVAGTAKQAVAAPLSAATGAPASQPQTKQKPKQSQGLAAFMTALQTPVVAPPSIPPAPGTVNTPHAHAAGGPTLLPQPPPSTLSMTDAPSLAGSTSAGGRGGGRGHRNGLWYIDYYDPSFNENPWRQLEKEHGLVPVGTWIDRPLGNKPTTRHKSVREGPAHSFMPSMV